MSDTIQVDCDAFGQAYDGVNATGTVFGKNAAEHLVTLGWERTRGLVSLFSPPGDQRKGSLRRSFCTRQIPIARVRIPIRRLDLTGEGPSQRPKETLGLRSQYAIRIYSWAQKYVTVGTNRILEELRKVLGLESVKDDAGNVIQEAPFTGLGEFPPTSVGYRHCRDQQEDGLGN